MQDRAHMAQVGGDQGQEMAMDVTGFGGGGVGGGRGGAHGESTGQQFVCKMGRVGLRGLRWGPPGGGPAAWHTFTGVRMQDGAHMAQWV